MPDHVSEPGQFGQQPSAALLAAQQLLLQRRQALPSRATTPADRPQTRPAVGPRPSLTTLFHNLPPHLGWESNALRNAHHSRPANPSQQPISLPASRTPLPPLPDTGTAQATIKCYPDLALRILHHELAAPGRIWFLLRHLDPEGRGCLSISRAREALTAKSALLRVCGWRQLRNLLAQGNGIFWSRDKSHIWLRAPLKVALTLGLDRLQTQPVALPIAILTARIGTVRAHFYASFHSGRKNRAPIARETIAHLTSVQARTQRRYEKTARVQTTRHIAMGPANSPKQLETQAWQRGTALFSFTDFYGRQGPRGKTYLAWQLPNSYTGPHQPAATGQKKRLNKTLRDLSMQGMTGNGQCLPKPLSIRYLANGEQAARAAGKQPNHDIYWPAPPRQAASFWYIMSAFPEVDA